MDLRDDTSKAAFSYADEVLCANWHPLVGMLAEGRPSRVRTAPAVLDVEGFLARLYSSQEA